MIKLCIFAVVGLGCLYIGGFSLFFALSTHVVPRDMYFHQTEQFWLCSVLLIPGVLLLRATFRGFRQRKQDASPGGSRS